MKTDASLIISVYNKIDFLSLVLAGLTRQSYKNFEVLIADDGSNDRTKEFITTYQKSAPFVIRHLWHEDVGFRKNKILNTAIESASSDYLIFIDGDCIPHRFFIEAHIKEHRTGKALCGRRVMLSDRITQSLNATNVINGVLDTINFRLILDGINGRASRVEDGLFIKSAIIRNLIDRKRTRILGSNFSIEKSLLEKINGFDEDYQGPGLGEDADIQYRLELIGVSFHSVKNYAIQYHLFHPRTIESFENQMLFQNKTSLNQAYCKNGLRKTI